MYRLHAMLLSSLASTATLASASPLTLSEIRSLQPNDVGIRPRIGFNGNDLNYVPSVFYLRAEDVKCVVDDRSYGPIPTVELKASPFTLDDQAFKIATPNNEELRKDISNYGHKVCDYFPKEGVIRFKHRCISEVACGYDPVIWYWGERFDLSFWK